MVTDQDVPKRSWSSLKHRPLVPGFSSQYPHGVSQLPVSPVLGKLKPSSDFLGHQT